MDLNETYACEGFKKIRFCKISGCISKGSIIIGLMRYIRVNPEYKHPDIPKFTKDNTFQELKEAYYEFIILPKEKKEIENARREN